MAAWSLGISIAALLVAIGGQVRDWISFRRSGPRISADAVVGLAQGSSVNAGPADFMLAGGGLEQLTRQSDGQAMFGIKISNSGRQAISVTGWTVSCEVSGIAYLSPPPDVIGPTLPFRLEGLSEEHWFMPLATAAGLARTHRTLGVQWSDGGRVMPDDEDERLVVTATTGDGRSASSQPVEVAQHVED